MNAIDNQSYLLQFCHNCFDTLLLKIIKSQLLWHLFSSFTDSFEWNHNTIFYVSMFSSQPFRPVWACCVRAGRRRTARLDRSGVSCDWSSRLNRRSWSWGWGNCRRPMRLNSWNLRTWGRWGENTHIKCCSLNPVWSGNVWCINSSFCGMNIKIAQGGVEVFLWHERGWSDLWRPVNIMWECKQKCILDRLSSSLVWVSAIVTFV